MADLQQVSDRRRLSSAGIMAIAGGYARELAGVTTEEGQYGWRTP